MSKPKTSFGRRGFLKGAAAGAAAIVATPVVAQQQGGRGGGRGGNQPNGAAVAREDGSTQPAAVTRTIERPGSDHMVDVIKALGIEYSACNPGSSFEGLHESL